MKLIFFYSVILLAISSCTIGAQTLTVETKFLTDEIPTRTTQQLLNMVLPIGEAWILRSSYHYQFTDQEEYVGLPRIRTAIHSFENIVVTSIRSLRFDVGVGGKINRYPDGTLMGDYHLGLHFSQPFFDSPEGPFVVMTVHGEASRNQETNTATAVDQKISSKDLSGAIEFDFHKMFTVTGKYTRQYYSDLNEKTSAYAALLYHPFSNPWIAVGYAYAYSNSLVSNWKHTNSVRLGFDPKTRLTTYEYSYFYNPYFTPIKEQGHLAIGVIRWGIIPNLAVYGKGTIPFSSTGLQKYFPSTGNTPTPIDYDVYYELEDILPVQYEASIITDMLDPVTIRLNAEYFKKPYYSYSAFGVNVAYSF